MSHASITSAIVPGPSPMMTARNPLTLTVATPDDTPRWEPAVASQLSEFGIRTEVQSLSGATFRGRSRSGDFPLWSTNVASYATNIAPTTLWVWLFAPVRPRKFGVYPKAQYEAGNFSFARGAYPITEDGWSVFTVRAPPIGEPNGPLREYHPSALSLAFVTNPPEAEFRRRVKTGMWLANWLLPTIPINNTMEQHFIDDTHWTWPRDTASWEAFKDGKPRIMEGILASGTISATPQATTETS